MLSFLPILADVADEPDRSGTALWIALVVVVIVAAVAAAVVARRRRAGGGR